MISHVYYHVQGSHLDNHEYQICHDLEKMKNNQCHQQYSCVDPGSLNQVKNKRMMTGIYGIHVDSDCMCHICWNSVYEHHNEHFHRSAWVS